jgi:hypothetical protein
MRGWFYPSIAAADLAIMSIWSGDKDIRKRVAFSAADARFVHAAIAFAAGSINLHLRLHEKERLFEARMQALVFARIGLQDFGNRTFKALFR